MHTITNTSTRVLGLAFAALVLLAMPFMFAQKAHADGFGEDTWGTYYPDSYGGDTWGSYYPDTYGNYYPDTSYNCSSCSTGYNYGSYDYGCSSCGSSSYAYNYPSSYGYDYSNPCYSCGYTPTNTYAPYTYAPSYNTPTDIYSPSNMWDNGNSYFNLPTTVTDVGNTTNSGNTYTYAPTDTCTGSSCNTTISTPINAPTTVTITNPNNNSTPSYAPQYAPYQPMYSAPMQQPYYSAPVAYNRPAPYVSLKSVPYTGLDLGPTGTALYWGFLAFWALLAAYLIAVKKAHVSLVNKLFGKKARTATVATATHAPAHAPAKAAQQPAVTSKFGNIDPFIAAQLQKIA